MKSTLLLGICGAAGAGKDTFAEHFHYYGFKQYSFAGPVKRVCEEAFNLSNYSFINRELKETTHQYWHLSPREMAQLVGTGLFRKTFGDDFWIRRLELQLIGDFDCRADVKAVISDVRFQNEAEWILANGGSLIHLTRPGQDGKVGILNHASEAGIDFQILNYSKGGIIYEVTNDGSKEQLKEKATTLIQTILNSTLIHPY